MPAPAGPARIVLPNVGALAVSANHAAWLTPDGEIEELNLRDAAMRAASGAIVCHAKATARRLGTDRFAAFDLLDLFAFVHPARFCLPTVRGLTDRLDLPAPKGLESQCVSMTMIAERLLADLMEGRADIQSDPVALAEAMAQGGWSWGPSVMEALRGTTRIQTVARAFEIWRKLPDWEDEPPEGPPGQLPVFPNESRKRLADMIAVERGHAAEPRPQQADFASAVTAAFTPRDVQDAPNGVIAEAGTGVGKTLGYLAPATLWAERNRAPVWVSTYTRNLQHQIDDELERRFPNPAEKAERVVIRKGRENYLCLLNYADAVRAAGQGGNAVATGLMARWAAATRDGDMTGGDFPGWLSELHGRPRTLGLADRRGECVYSACEHYRRCFIERNVRRARHADIVIANHALVMIQAALGGTEDANLPTRYVFDEGHHLFDAADSAFSAHLTAFETAELRRWLVGAETSARSRARGLKRRIEDLVAGDEAMLDLLDQINEAARALPGDGWNQRVSGDEPRGPAERFLFALRKLVYTRAEGLNSPYSLETEPRPAPDDLLEAALALDKALAALEKPIAALAKKFAEKLDDEADKLPGEDRRRIDAMARGLVRRGTMTLAAWRGMLKALASDGSPDFIDWFGVERIEGRDSDFGYYRHHLDPTIPFAATIGAQAHGLVVTSATLTDTTGNVEEDWAAAGELTGVRHLMQAPVRAQVPSPFDYAGKTKVFVVNDVRKDDLDQVASAYRTLFLAAGGGGLGLFTAIQRLRAVRERIAEPLEAEGIPLYAQHLDGLDVGTLVEIFRAEEDACLLGTDAVRDGVDVPGRALRLIVFDRVPWPRPDILHKARRQAFGAKKWDERLTRRRLRQAYGRLIRRADDSGVFVLLDPMMPSRLSGAFPPGVEIKRVGLAEAVEETRRFLDSPASSEPKDS
ncbi:MAG TPA: ATP-dependent DNA helicase [Alphaproteobacteria bacterium]|nr:ATP-dependent DNA helicase [Alphaproteobacteria bacterium]